MGPQSIILGPLANIILNPQHGLQFIASVQTTTNNHLTTHPQLAPNISVKSHIVFLWYISFSFNRRYSATLEDLVSVLLRGDATSRPSADQVLWVPALQDYVKAHVMRTAALTNKQRQPSPAPMQEYQRMKSSDEKENVSKCNNVNGRKYNKPI